MKNKIILIQMAVVVFPFIVLSIYIMINLMKYKIVNNKILGKKNKSRRSI